MNLVTAVKTIDNLVSVEVQPPKLGDDINQLFNFLDNIESLRVEYVDITYHPEQIMGYKHCQNSKFPITIRKKPGTVGIAGAIIGRYENLKPIPHVICTGFDKYSTEEYLVELAYLGVENIVALRGDNPKDKNNQILPFPNIPFGHKHANTLIEQIVNLKKGIYVGAEKGSSINFCIGAACYPEMHFDSLSWKKELYWTRKKVDVGADYLITQMFFDNTKYYDFIEKSKVNVPIIPGIKPLTNCNQIVILPELFGCSIPEKLKKQIEKYKSNNEDIKKVGIEWCINQALNLRKNGAPSLHFYETNTKNSSVLQILPYL